MTISKEIFASHKLQRRHTYLNAKSHHDSAQLNEAITTLVTSSDRFSNYKSTSLHSREDIRDQQREVWVLHCLKRYLDHTRTQTNNQKISSKVYLKYIKIVFDKRKAWWKTTFIQRLPPDSNESVVNNSKHFISPPGVRWRALFDFPTSMHDLTSIIYSHALWLF